MSTESESSDSIECRGVRSSAGRAGSRAVSRGSSRAGSLSSREARLSRSESQPRPGAWAAGLSDGASAIYGSDAIGGVVNFILRDKFDGVQVSGDFAESDHGDGFRRHVSLTAGHTGQRGSIVAGIE